MSTVEDPICAGAPLDVNDVARPTINDCPFPCSHVVLALLPNASTGEPLTVLATVCTLHRRAVESYLSRYAITEDIWTAEIAALPTVVEELTSDGVDPHWMTYQAA